MIIVTLIIFSLVLLVIALNRTLLERARTVKLIQEIVKLRNALKLFYVDNGRLPDDLQELISPRSGRGRTYIKVRKELRLGKEVFLERANGRLYLLSPWNTRIGYSNCGRERNICCSLKNGHAFIQVYLRDKGGAIPEKVIKNLDITLDDGDIKRGFIFQTGDNLCVEILL